MSACLNDLFSLWTFLDAIDGLQEGYIETTFLPIRVSQKGCVKWQDKEPVGCMSKEPRSRSDNCEQTSGRMSFCRNVQQIWESLFFLLKTAVWYFPVATFGAAYPSWMSNFFMLAKLLCVLNMTWHPKVVLGCKSFHKVVPYSSAASVSLSIFVPYFTVCFALAHVFTAFCPTGRKQENKNTTGLRYFLFSSCMWNPPPPSFIGWIVQILMIWKFRSDRAMYKSEKTCPLESYWFIFCLLARLHSKNTECFLVVVAGHCQNLRTGRSAFCLWTEFSCISRWLRLVVSLVRQEVKQIRNASGWTQIIFMPFICS